MPSSPDPSHQRAGALAAARWNVARLAPAAVEHALTTDAATGGGAEETSVHHRRTPRDVDVDAAVREWFGVARWLVTGSGRGAEAVVAAALVRPGMVVVADEVYVSGEWWIRRFGGAVTDVDVGNTTNADDPDPGPGVDPDQVAFVQVTAPHARLGSRVGEPVTTDALLRIRAWVDRACPGVPLVLDASRLWENAVRCGDSVRRFTDLADIVLLSAAKDLGARRGGLVVARDDRWWPHLAEAARVLEHPSGGLDEAEIAALVTGLDAAGSTGAIATRVAEVDDCAARLRAAGVPVAGTGAGSLFLDASVWLSQVPDDELRAQTLLNLLFLTAGIQALGTSTDEPAHPQLVRIAVRRSTDLLVDVLPEVFERARSQRSGLVPGARDRAAPYLQPAAPADPDAWPHPPAAHPAIADATWFVGRCGPGRGPQRALAEAWGRTLPGAQLRGGSTTWHDLHALLGGTPTSTPATIHATKEPGPPAHDVRSDDLVVVELTTGADALELDAAALDRRLGPEVDACWAATAAGGMVAVRRPSPLSPALDAGTLFTISTWLG